MHIAGSYPVRCFACELTREKEEKEKIKTRRQRSEVKEKNTYAYKQRMFREETIMANLWKLHAK